MDANRDGREKAQNARNGFGPDAVRELGECEEAHRAKHLMTIKILDRAEQDLIEEWVARKRLVFKA